MSGTYSSTINQAAQQYGVPASLVKAVATQESGLGSGSGNVMQVNGMGNDPIASIQKGTEMLAHYWQQTGGDLGWTLAMYNMGPGVKQWADQHGISDPATAMKMFSSVSAASGAGPGDPNYIANVSRYLG